MFFKWEKLPISSATKKPTYRIFQKRKVTDISAFSSPRATICDAALGK